MCLQEFVNPFWEEAENAFFQPNPSISEIAVNLGLKLKTIVYSRPFCFVFAYLRQLNLPWDSEDEKRVSSRSCVFYSRVNESKRCIEKYLLLKPKRRDLSERPSMGAFNLQSCTDVCFQEFVSFFCEEAENAFFHPNPSISEIALNLRLKLKTNVSFRLLFCVFAYLR